MNLQIDREEGCYTLSGSGLGIDLNHDQLRTLRDAIADHEDSYAAYGQPFGFAEYDGFGVEVCDGVITLIVGSFAESPFSATLFYGAPHQELLDIGLAVENAINAFGETF